MKNMKRIAVFSTAMLLTAPLAITSLAQGSRYRAGDVNQDGMINTGDATRILQYCADLLDTSKNASIYKELMDVNGDLAVNTGDVTYLLRKLTDKEEALTNVDYSYQRVYGIRDNIGDEAWIADSWYRQYRENNQSNDVITVVRSRDELIQLFAPEKTRFDSLNFTRSDSDPGFDILDKYDDSFFAEKSLVFLHVWDSMLSHELAIPQIAVDGDNITMNIDLLHTMITEQMECEYIVAVELDNLPVSANITMDVKNRIMNWD